MRRKWIVACLFVFGLGVGMSAVAVPQAGTSCIASCRATGASLAYCQQCCAIGVCPV